MKVTDSTPTSIAHALRDDLLDGALEPGTRLTEEALTARFGCGRHSVRAGLQTLVSEGLLEHQRNRGIVVPAVTTDRIDDMCSYRSILEIGALRLALAEGADFSAVEEAVRHLESLPKEAPWRHVIEAHSAVHSAIVEAGGNPRVVAAHQACQNELNCMLATIRAVFSAPQLAAMHRHLADQLKVGGEAALRALEDDLELGGRAAMHLALRRRTAPAHLG
ncbi:GntR family transcriptional regulator [Amycolatopsis jejuensis]|uniref:GntR family transcriptional regulator n=1 Tax=Amycolatopsis jejuensis TaxID=330084 RepID=UPI0006921BE5|nr:GntR family transcriptional regulator [Amycolatopsis jejuensis]